MSLVAQWKTIGYAAAIFIAGGISGGALGVYETKSHLMGPPPEGDLAVRLRNRFQTRLGLTPDQIAKIDPIIQTVAADLHSIRLDAAQRVNKVFEDSYSQVSAILTPDQRVKLEQMQTERREIMQGHWGQDGRRRPGGPRRDGPDHDGPDHDGPDHDGPPPPPPGPLPSST